MIKLVIIIEKEILQKVYQLNYNGYRIIILNKQLSTIEKEDIIKNIGGDGNSLYYKNENGELESYNIHGEESIDRKVPEKIEDFPTQGGSGTVGGREDGGQVEWSQLEPR